MTAQENQATARTRSVPIAAVPAWVIAVAVVIIVLGIAILLARLAPGIGELGAATSCEEHAWPATVVSCAEARRSSNVMTTVAGTRIWLTTLAAVDARFKTRRLTMDHPSDPTTPVWLFIHDGLRSRIQYVDETGVLVWSPSEVRMLYVADATNSQTREGAFVYIFGWSELGDPDVPSSMPSIEEAGTN
jgi:hypothetical protein